MSVKVMVSGLGKMGKEVFNALLEKKQFEVLPVILTGKGSGEIRIKGKNFKLIPFIPNNKEREEEIDKVIEKEGKFYVIDFTHSNAVIPNAETYVKKGLPFVMGTTGGDLSKLKLIIENSSIPAVVAPNMAPPIVAIQAMMEYLGNTFPMLFTGYSLEIIESHQQGKEKTSGTAISMLEYFSKLGITDFDESDIQKIRDPEKQRSLGVLEKYLKAHGWHRYILRFLDQIHIELIHNVNGRGIYADGSLKALAFLKKKIEEGVKGRMFSMIDVLSETKN